MTALRLLADDLTGALDTAAELVPATGPLPVFWSGRPSTVLPPSCAFDSGTREGGREAAEAAVAGFAPALADAALAFKKVDSLLRGHPAAELAACLAHGSWTHCIMAPAFPHQGRITCGGVQLARDPDGVWREVANLSALLAAAGVDSRKGEHDAPLRPGVTIFDATSDAELQAVARLGRDAGGRLLWCGSAGLARALAQGAPEPQPIRLAGQVLGLFGSDQAATDRQLDACAAYRLRISGGSQDAERLATRLDRDGVALVSLDLPSEIRREEAADRIAGAFAALVAGMERPGALLVAGGETLRRMCDALGATSLEVRGRFEPGLPYSVMKGGRWDGLTVVSKSGAFGGPSLWRDLLAANGLLGENGRNDERLSA